MISQNTFVNNQAAIGLNGGVEGARAAGAILDTEISNNVIAGTTPYGAIDIVGGGQGATGNRIDGVRIVNDTIVANDSGLSVRGLAGGNQISNVDVRNTIFWMNRRDLGGEDIFNARPAVRASIVKDPEFASGNIAADPRFVGAQDFHLQGGSPAIDAGTSDGAPVVDIEARARVGRPDSGAYEFGAASRSRLTVAFVPFGGTGAVTSAPAGITCPGTCSAAFDRDATVTLTAMPDSGSRVAWSGACSGSGTCMVKLDAAKTVVATFSRVVFPLTVAVTGKGRVVTRPAGIACPGACAADFDKDEAVTLTATPDPGYRIVWSGGCSGSEPCTVTLDAAKTVTATFVPFTHALSVSVSGKGRVTSAPTGIACPSTCTASFDEGTAVTLVAVPASGYRFGGWTGACTGRADSCSVSVGADVQVTAKFARLSICKKGGHSTKQRPCRRR